MRYRTLAGEDVSVLGFGCMRFPTNRGRKDRQRQVFGYDREGYRERS